MNASLTLNQSLIEPLVQLAAGLGYDKRTPPLPLKSPIKCTGTLTLGEREITLKVFDASVSSGDVLLWTDKGTITLVVDRYGDRVTWEVFDWDLEGEVDA